LQPSSPLVSAIRVDLKRKELAVRARPARRSRFDASVDAPTLA